MAEYPEEEELEQIRKWDPADFHGLMQFIEPLWTYEAWKQDGDIYTIATSGWSGNEEIIVAMQDNIVWWAMYWHSSNRGGRHIFAPCTIETIEKLS